MTDHQSTEPIFPTNTHALREAWLMEAIEKLRPLFKRADLTIPDKIRCSFGIPSPGRKGNAIGECWYAASSDDGHVEIFISPLLDDPLLVLGTLVHELVHAALPAGTRHGPVFRAAATRVGLVGPMRSTKPGPLLEKALADIAAFIGPLPHARLNIRQLRDDATPAADAPKKQGTRMLKAECPPCCGFTVRIAAKWLRPPYGAPLCPRHMQPLTVTRPGAPPASV